MGVLGDLSKYQQFQAAEAMAAAAQAPGGAAGQGMGLAMGMMMAQQVGGLMGGQNAPAGAATPPPLPQETSWYLAAGGQQQGPYAVAKLRELAAARQLTRDTLVWTQGMAAWTKAGEVSELAALLAAVPPPLPPA
jgi:hypothetical protein